VAEWLRQRGRPFLFSSAVTVPDTAATLAAIDLLEESTQLVDRLWENARTFQQEMRTWASIRARLKHHHPSDAGDVQLAREFSRRLFEEGVFAQAIGYPTVPRVSAHPRNAFRHA
jgi:glycine C-acetyltransferase